MRITLTVFIAFFLPFTAFLQKTGTIILTGDADYYDYDKQEFVVYYNDEALGSFDKRGFFNYSEGQKVPLTIKHPDFKEITISELKFSKKNAYLSIFEELAPEGKKRLDDQLKAEQLKTCTGSDKEEILNDTLRKIDSNAHFPGDSAGVRTAFFKYISENLRYPQKCVEFGIEGKIYLSFIVEADGRVTCIEIKKGADYFLDKEALRLIGSLPKFTPAMSNGIPVPVVYLLPISFKLT